MEQELYTLPEHLSSPSVFHGIRVTRSSVLCVLLLLPLSGRHQIVDYSATCMCMLCRSLFVLLYFFIWPLCCLFFWLHLWYIHIILIAILLSSNLINVLCCLSLQSFAGCQSWEKCILPGWQRWFLFAGGRNITSGSEIGLLFCILNVITTYRWGIVVEW